MNGGSEMFVTRPATAVDTAAIHELIARIYADYNFVLDVEQEDPQLREPAAWFGARGGEFWVVEHDGRIVASCAVYLHDGAAELKELYVDRSVRRRGLARALMARAMAFARAAGMRRMILWSDTLFTEAHRLYESLGFRRGPTRDVRCTNVFSEYFYERELG